MINQEIFAKKLSQIYGLNPVLMGHNRIKFFSGGMCHIMSFFGAWPGETPTNYVSMRIEHKVWPKDHKYVLENNLLMLIAGDGMTYFEHIQVDGSSGNVELRVSRSYPSKDRLVDKYSLLSPHNRIDEKTLFDNMDLMMVELV